jgi:hypothetical protein
MSNIPKDEDSPVLIKIKPRRGFEEAKAKFLEEVSKVTLPKIKKTRYYPEGHPKAGQVQVAQRDLIIGNVGRTDNFGFGKTRSGYKPFVANAKHPELLRAIVALGNVVVPKGWKYSMITLNHGVKAKKHIDTTNVGFSVIVGVGDYSGGELNVFNPDGSGKQTIDIKDKPAMFNGAILPHSTEPFKGERYTLIFFNQKAGASIPGYRTVGKGYLSDEEDDVADLVGGVFA